MRSPWLFMPLVWLGSAVSAQTVPHAVHDSLGAVSFPVSCSAESQAEFNRATALLHHMTYPRAREAYTGIARRDPRCAMAHWGIAMTLFQPLWPTRPSPAALVQGWAETEKARQLGAPTRREQGFIAAAAAFFQEPESTDYWLRVRRWAAAMERLYRGYPDDPEVTAFFALSLLALPPAGPDSGPARSATAAELLVSLYRRNPAHPGAMHYLVHANDAPGREHDSLSIVRRYAAVAPANPHALHMPTHIFTRLGDWDGVIRGNLLAAEAALRQPAGDMGQYVWDEFPHAIEYLVYAYLQKGEPDSALAQLKRLEATPRLEPTFKTAFHLASTRARYVLERKDWAAALALPPREPGSLAWDRFTWPEAITWFAKGMGAVHLGRNVEARTALDRLATLEKQTREAGETLFADQVRILELELRGWFEAATDPASGLALLRQALALEEATPKPAVTPAPTIPAAELLGDLHLALGQPTDARAAYQHSVEWYPARRNSLLGLGQSTEP